MSRPILRLVTRYGEVIVIAAPTPKYRYLCGRDENYALKGLYKRQALGHHERFFRIKTEVEGWHIMPDPRQYF